MKKIPSSFGEIVISATKGLKEGSNPTCWPAIDLFNLFFSRYHVDHIWKTGKKMIAHIMGEHEYFYFDLKYSSGEKYTFCMQNRIKEKWHNLFVLNEKKDKIVFAYDYWSKDDFLLAVNIKNQKTMNLTSPDMKFIEDLIFTLKGQRSIERELLIELSVNIKN